MSRNRLETSDAGSPGGPASQGQSQSLVEQSLVEILNTLLNRTDITPTDQFFELGGDSLLALVTIEQINQRLGWSLEMSDLMRYPSVRALATNKAIPQAANTERAMVRMTSRGSRTPIIFIHPVSGMVLAYSKLVHHLGDDRGCYGIQSPMLTATSVPDTIEGIAELYADLISDELGDDDFHLAGWSAGGVIAAELAKVVAARGLNLRRLVLVDSYAGNASALDTTEPAMLREFRADMLGQVFPHARDEQTTPEDGDPAAVFKEISAALFGAGTQAGGDAGTQFVQRLHDAYRATFRAMAAYRPAPVQAEALLLHTADNDTLDTWRSVLRGGLTLEPLGSDHYGLLREPEAAKIAAQIDAYCK